MSLIVFIIILSNLHLKHNRMVRFLDAFLDALLMRTNGKLEQSFFVQKLISIYIYIGDLSYYMVKGTLSTLIRRSYTVLFSDNCL